MRLGLAKCFPPGSREASLLPCLPGWCLYHALDVASPTPGIDVVILGASRMRLSPLSAALAVPPGKKVLFVLGCSSPPAPAAAR